jgi:hypothetical protein
MPQSKIPSDFEYPEKALGCLLHEGRFASDFQDHLGSCSPRAWGLFLADNHDVSDALHHSNPAKVGVSTADDVEHASIGAGDYRQFVQNDAKFIKTDRSRTHRAQTPKEWRCYGCDFQSRSKYVLEITLPSAEQ